MYVYCVRKLGLDINKVNVYGGAIALGHPLDKLLLCYARRCHADDGYGVSSRCTGARQIATGLNALSRRNGKVSAF